MTEPSVQVPVSLIERLKWHMEHEQLELLDETVEEVVALLSQPNPTAWTQGDNGPDAYGGEGGSVDPIPASPPSIADMAPGTFRSIMQVAEGSTFWARQHGDPEERFWFLAAGMGIVSLDAIMAHANSIDPSTIRDVTPPGAAQ